MPWKAIVPDVFVNVTVAASTELWNVVPPEFVTVTVPMFVDVVPSVVPTRPETVMAPVASKVTSEADPPATP